MKPGRELDALVATVIMGWRKDHATVSVMESWNKVTGEHLIDIPELPRYSTEISAAWEVVHKLKTLKGIKSEIFSNHGSGWYVQVFRNFQDRVTASSDTFPHAVCLAALKVVE